MRSCRKKIRWAKAQVEFDLAATVKDNKKSFYKCIGSKRRVKKCLHYWLNAEGNVVREHEKKAEALIAFYFLNIKTSCPQDTHLPDGEMSEVPIIHEEMISDLLCHFGTHKSVGSDGIHPRVLCHRLSGCSTEMLERSTYKPSTCFPLQWKTAGSQPLLQDPHSHLMKKLKPDSQENQGTQLISNHR